MPATIDMTTLAQVKIWGQITQVNSDDAISSLITALSRQALTYLLRPSILPATYAETFNGNGVAQGVQLTNFPVISVASVVIDDQTVPQASTRSTAGWALEPVNPAPPSRNAMLFLRGRRFDCGLQNVVVTYRAGYQVTAEPATVPTAAGYIVEVMAPYGAWASDQGATYADGTPLTKVDSNPAIGQYSVACDGAVYSFAPADAGRHVLISYGYIPADIGNAVSQWVAEVFSYQSRIAIRQRSLSGQNVTYVTPAIPSSVACALAPYQRVFA